MSKLAISIDGHTYEVAVDVQAQRGSTFTVQVNGETLSVTLPDPDMPTNGSSWVIVDERPYEISYDRDLRWITEYGAIHHIETRDLEATVTRPRSSDGRVKAPIPGLITRVMVTPGQQVEIGQPLLVLEAMKMENEIRAPRAGTVSALHVNPGQGVSRSEVLAEIS